MFSNRNESTRRSDAEKGSSLDPSRSVDPIRVDDVAMNLAMTRDDTR